METPKTIDWKQRCRVLHEIGLKIRADKKFSEEGFPFVLQTFNDKDECQHFHLVEGLSPQGRMFLKVQHHYLKQTNATAAIFQSDCRQIEPEPFSKYFHLPLDMPFEEWNRARTRIVEAHGGQFKNLPKKTWSDSIITAVKGPFVEPFQMHTSYTGDAEDKVVYEPTREDGRAVWYMLPDWWEPVKVRA